MHTLDPGIIVPDLVFGSIAVVAGIFVFVFRRQLRDRVVSSEKTALGQRRGEALGRLQTTFWAGVTGIAISVFGLCTTAFGVVALAQHWGRL